MKTLKTRAIRFVKMWLECDYGARQIQRMMMLQNLGEISLGSIYNIKAGKSHADVAPMDRHRSLCWIRVPSSQLQQIFRALPSDPY